MADDFKINIDSELNTEEAEKKLNNLLNENYKITIDVDVSGKDTSKKLKQNIENGIKNVKIDTSALSKSLADSFNITDKSTVNKLQKQISNMISQLGKSWNGKKFDISGGSFESSMTDVVNTLKKNAKTLRSSGAFDGFYDYFKNQKILVTDALKKELGDVNYKELLNNNIGKLVTDTKKSTATINSMWGELNGKFPNLFPDNITNQADQLNHVLDVWKKAQSEIKKISVENMNSIELGQLDSKAWESVVGIGAKMESALRQSITESTQAGKTTVDLDVSVNAAKIAEDIRNAIKSASSGAGEKLDLNLDINSEQLLSNLRIAIEKLGARDEPIKVDVDVDKASLQEKLNSTCKDMEIPVEFKIDSEDIAAKIKAAVDNIQDIELDLKVNTDFSRQIDESIDPDIDSSGLAEAQQILHGFNNAGQQTQSIFQSMGGTVKEAFNSVYNVSNLLQDGMYKIAEAGQKAVETVKDFNDIKTNLAMATNADSTYINNLMNEYNDLAKELGNLTGSVAESADSWLRQGRSLKDTNSLIKDSLVLSKDAELSSTDASEILTATLNGFQMAADQASKVNDILTSIDLESASGADSIGTALMKVASQANNAGVSLEKTSAIIATMKDVTQDSDESIGTAMKSILSRMNQIKAGKFVDAETGESLNDTEKVLKKIGVSMRDNNDMFRDSEDVLDDIAKRWNTLDKNSQKATATAVAGTYQYNKFVAAMDNWDKVEKLTKVAYNSDGTAQKKFDDNYLSSLEAKTNSLKASLEGLSTSIISDEMYAGVLDGAKAITDFVDKTNLLKGALAGLGTAGGLFVFQQIGMFAKEAVTEMSNLGNAMRILKVGNFGTSEFQEILNLTKGLSDSQMELVLSSTALTDAQKVQLLTNAGVAQAEAESTVAAMGLASANGTATASTISLSSAFEGLWATLMANPLILVAAGVTAAVAAYSSYQQSIKEAVQSASEAGQTFAENYSSIDDNIAKVQELRTALASGTLSEQEAYQAKSDLLSIQNQLSESYGDQAEGIDLVNGKLDEQIEKMQQIQVENAKDYLNDEAEGIDKAKSEMEKERYYSFGVIEQNEKNKDLLSDLQQITKTIDGIDLSTNPEGDMFVEFRGNAELADESINEFLNKLRDLKDEMEESGKDTSALDNIFEFGSGQLKKNQKILDEYQDIYKNSLQADMISKGFGEGKPATLLNEYTQAVQDYNDALSSGDTSAIEKAKTAFDDVQNSVDNLLKNKNFSAYKELFDEVGSALDESTIKANDFKDAVKDMFEDGLDEEYQKIKDWGLEKYESQIKNGTLPSVFGNVDMDHRKVITWTLDEIESARDQLKDIKYYDGDGNFIESYYDQLKESAEKGYESIDSVFGDVMEQIEGYSGITDIAFSHIVDNDDGTYKFLGQKTAKEYIYGILDAAKEDGDLSLDHILELDKVGIKDAAMFDENGKQVGEAYIHGIISGFNENAADISALTHFAGKDGAIELIKKNNPFRDFTDVELKGMNIKGDNLNDTQKALAKVVEKAKDLNIIEDDSSESIAKVVDMLTDMGLTGSVSIDSLTESFSQAQSSIKQATSDISSLQSLLSNSMTGKGMSADDVTAFKEMFGDDATSALEKTANGYHINQQALAKLQNQQKQSVKSDYLTAIAEEQEALQKVNEQMAKAIFNGEDISGLQTQKQNIESNISSLQDLAYQYQNAMSAYNQWQAAMSGGEEGDMYDSIQSNLKSAKDLYDKGLVGQNKFKEFVDLMSNKDLSNASVDEIVAEYESAMPKIERYFTEGQEGAVNFLNDIQNINKEWAHMNEDGSWDINFGTGNDQDIANALGIDVEAVQAILRKLNDYGFEVNLDQPVKSLDELKSSAESAKEALDGMGDISLDNIDLNSSSFGEVTDNIDKVKEYIQTINDSDLEPDVKTERLEQANNILEYLVQKQQELGKSVEISVDADELENKITEAKSALDEFKNSDGTVDLSVEGAQEAVNNLQSLLYQKQSLTNNSAIISVDSSQVDGALGDAIAKIQEYQAAVNNLNAQTELQKAGVQIDTSDAQVKVQQLAGEIQGLDGEAKASLGLDTSAFDSALSTITSTEIDVDAGVNLDPSSLGTIQSTISAITPEILVKAGVDSSQVDAYKAESEDKEGTVKFKVDSSAVDAYKPDNKSATVTYSVSVSGLDKITDQSRTLTYNVKTNGSTKNFNGTANISGTANASGNWSAPRTETSLVGELGQETVVRNGKFFTVGDDGAEFVNIKKGDIIFNHKQTEELFKNGHVTSGGGRAKVIGEAFVQGTAYSNAHGRFNYGSSGSKANSGSSGSSSSKSNNTKNNTNTTNNNTDSTSNAEETKETLDWIETKLDRIKRDIGLIDKTASSTYKTWSKRNEALVSELSQVSNELNVQQQAYDRYIQQANSVGLSEDWASKVRDGRIDIEEITDSDLKDKISDYKTWYEKALDCRDAIADLREQESKLYEQKFNNLKDEYDAILEQFDHTQKMLESYIDITEAEGYISSSKYYDSLIENENEKLNRLNEERDNLINSLNEALASGKIEKYSESWYSMQNEINSVDEAILDCNKNTVEWGNNIRQIQWDVFDKIQDRISGITDEADFLEKLMSSEKMYDDKNGGEITDYGKATLGLHGVKYNTAMQQADEYRKEMEKIQEALNSDPYNQDLIDRRKELLELQQESILAAKDEKDSIKDLIEDGINAELDALQDLIDKYTDLLDNNKDLYDYTKELEKQQKNIASLEKQLAAYQGDTSEEGASKRQQIQNDLNDARQDLAETQYERSIADQKKLLDDLYDDYEEMLNLRLDNIDMLVQDVITNVNAESAGIRETLETVSNNVGYNLTDSMNTIWSSANNVITTYGDKFSTQITGVQQAIIDLKNLLQQQIDASNKKTQANTTAAKKPATSNNNTKPAAKPATNTNKNSSQGNGKVEIGDEVKFVSGSYYYSSDGQTPTGNQMQGQTVYVTNINTASWAKKQYHIARDKAGTHPLGWVDLSQISGYKTGTDYVPYDQMAKIAEDGDEAVVHTDGRLEKVKALGKSDAVINNKSFQNLLKFAANPIEVVREAVLGNQHIPDDFIDVSTPNANVTNNVTNNISNTVNIDVDSPVNYTEFYREIMRQFQNDKKAEAMIQDMTLGRLNGKGSMYKYRTMF